GRSVDQGSYGEGQNASAVGRTWAITAFRPISWARSSHARYSSCCASAVSPEREGQSMFSTEESHIARNCRAGEAGGSVAGAGGSAGAAAPVVVTAAVPTAAPVLSRKKERRSTGCTALWSPRSVTRITHPRIPVRGGQAAPGTVGQPVRASQHLRRGISARGRGLRPRRQAPSRPRRAPRRGGRRAGRGRSP